MPNGRTSKDRGGSGVKAARGASQPTSAAGVKKIGPDQRKVQPKLRMVANASTTVNALRADRSASVAVKSERLLKEVPPLAGEAAAPKRRRELPGASRGKLREIAGDVYVNVFIETADSAEPTARFPGETARRGTLATATVPLAKLPAIARREGVTHVEMGEPIASPTPVVSRAKVAPPDPERRKFGDARRHHDGAGVLVGIVDVQGFDFAHEDFLDERGETRFVSIWDQGGATRPSPGVGPNARFDYGSEILRDHLNAAVRASKPAGLPAHELEPQSQMAEGSHGTHVASIAAGNRGVCRKADIAAVLLSLPEDDYERRRSFYDSTRLVHAVEYLLDLAERRKQPISINVSLGTNGHAHDASSALSRWIDAALSVPGRCVTVAAGNAGQEKPEFEGDRGYVMGRIHTSGQVAARELYADVDWLVVGNGLVDVSENEFEIWYGAQDRFAVSLRPPGGKWIGPVRPNEYMENVQLEDGSFFSIYNELYHPANGANYIAVYLSPFYTRDGVVGVKAGEWTVRLEGHEVRDGRFHGWIERDDPRRVGRVGSQEYWSFPSFFSERSNIDNSSVSSLACGLRVVSVANLDDARERMNVTSSQGPTRDARQKPDVAAPGTNVVAARAFSPDERWIAMTGTSMASPHVAGLAGLMLATEPTLTAAQIGGIIQRTSRPLPGSGFAWANDAGFGRLREEECLAEAAGVNDRHDLLPKGKMPGGQHQPPAAQTAARRGRVRRGRRP